jgi:hypothetical protein
MSTDDELERAFPSINHIERDDLRAGVRTAWLTAIEENGIESLEAIPWFPPAQRDLDLPEETLVAHVRDVTTGAVALAELLIEHRDTDIDMDILIAGALVHDVSKCYEFDGMGATPIGTLLGHPHYGVHVVSAAGLPVEVAHIVLAHTSRTSVEPATLEAELVRRADESAAAAIRWVALSDLRNG